MEYMFTYENKVIEYLMKISELGRNLNENDNYYFSNNDNMYDWYVKQCNKIKYERKNNVNMSAKRFCNIMLFAKLEDYIFELNNARKIKEYKKKVLEYISKISEINRDINKDDNFIFHDGSYMYNWYKQEYEKLINDYYSKKMSKYRLEEMMLFLKINNILNIIDDKSTIINDITKLDEIEKEIVKIKTNKK